MIVRLHLIFMTFIRCYGLIHYRRLPISRVDVDANHTVTLLNYISGLTEKPRKRGAFVPLWEKGRERSKERGGLFETVGLPHK